MVGRHNCLERVSRHSCLYAFYTTDISIYNILGDVRDSYLVQILAKAPNLDQMSTIPYSFDFTAISSLTHVRSIHTNVELNSKHITICRFCVRKTFFTIRLRDVNMFPIHVNMPQGHINRPLRYVNKHSSNCYAP
jgi:hypothetical protein